jgi:hypothetical protein
LQSIQVAVVADDLAQMNGLFSAQGSQFHTIQP